MNRFYALAGACATLALGAFAGTASAAAPGPTPNGFTGAWNMLSDPTMLAVPMTHDAPQGNAGMCAAVLVSSGTGC